MFSPKTTQQHMKASAIIPTSLRTSTIKNCFCLSKDALWQGCGEKGTLCTVSGNINWCSNYGKQ